MSRALRGKINDIFTNKPGSAVLSDLQPSENKKIPHRNFQEHSLLRFSRSLARYTSKSDLQPVAD